MSNITTHRGLQEARNRWKRSLKLQPWDIDVEFVDNLEDLTNADSDAEVDWNFDSQSANIKVVRPYLNSKPTEQRLIHELLHIRFPLYPKEQMAKQIFEAGIDAVADLLYEMAEIIRGLRKT